MTSMMAQSDGNGETGGTSGVATQMHTDGMAHRLLAVTDDWDDRNTTPSAKTPLNLMLPIIPNYLRRTQIPIVHNPSV